MFLLHHISSAEDPEASCHFTPDVASAAACFSADDLWSHKVWRSGDLTRRRNRLTLQQFGRTKIPQLQITMVITEYIGTWKQKQPNQSTKRLSQSINQSVKQTPAVPVT